jgi:hypothetical protein
VKLFRLVFRPVLGFRDREVARDVCARDVCVRDVCVREVCARALARDFVRDLDFICCLYYVLFF